MVAITVRRAKEDESELLASFQVEMARETEEKPLDFNKVQKGCEHMLKTPPLGFYYIAEVDGAPAGMCAITFEWSDWRNGMWWWVQDVFVTKEHRKKGVFKTLFEHLRTEAVNDEQVVGLRLYHEHENHGAHETYLKCGLKDCHYMMMEDEFRR